MNSYLESIDQMNNKQRKEYQGKIGWTLQVLLIWWDQKHLNEAILKTQKNNQGQLLYNPRDKKLLVALQPGYSASKEAQACCGERLLIYDSSPSFIPKLALLVLLSF